MDTFEDGIVHFLDILVHKNGETDVYTKTTNTGQYSHIDSFVPWRYKTSWAYALFIRAKKICSTDKLFSSQRTRINKVLSWNGFPSYQRNKLIKKFNEDLQKSAISKDNLEPSSTDKDIESLFLKIPFMGAEGEKLVKSLKKKIQRNVSRKLIIRVIYTTTTVSNVCSEKDEIPEEQKNNIIYKIVCPGCG